MVYYGRSGRRRQHFFSFPRIKGKSFSDASQKRQGLVPHRRFCEASLNCIHSTAGKLALLEFPPTAHKMPTVPNSLNGGYKCRADSRTGK